MPIIPIITINLTDIVRVGTFKLIVRITEEDKELVDKAARICSMRQSEFTRTVLIQAAREINKRL